MINLRAVGGFLDRVIRGLGLLGGILLVLNALFCSYEIVMRYFFKAPTIWVMEVSIYLVIASTFLAFAFVLIEKAHVKVDFITNYFSPRTLILLEIITSFWPFYSVWFSIGKAQNWLSLLLDQGRFLHAFESPHVHSRIFHFHRKLFSHHPIYSAFKKPLDRSHLFKPSEG